MHCHCCTNTFNRFPDMLVDRLVILTLTSINTFDVQNMKLVATVVEIGNLS
jgi:hypothetical protein